MKVLQKIWQWPLHVFLLGAFPAVFFYTQNQNELTPGVLVVPIFVTWLGSFTMLSVTSLLTKNWLRAAFITSFLVSLFFLYPHLYGAVGFGKVTLLGVVVTTSKLFNLATLVVVVTGVVLIARLKTNLSDTTRVVNMVAVCMLVVSLLSSGGNADTRTAKEKVRNDLLTEKDFSQGPRAEELPDIYYLIFDRYANETSLASYGFDNTPFLSQLVSEGFSVVHKATGNYPNTTESLASSLNMKYLDGLAGRVGTDSSSVTPLHNSIEDNAVSSFLRQRGYSFYNIGSWWEATRTNRFATKSYVAEQGGLGLDEFSTNLLLHNTPLGKLAARFFPEAYTSHGARFQYQLASLREVAAFTKPKFVFSHMLMPHDPYIYNADCTERSTEAVEGSTYKDNYLQQLACANIQILRLVKDIKATSSRDALIILQSDEGPHAILASRSGSTWLGYPDQTYQEKLRIFSAVFSPDGFALPEGTSPVNTFRYVFNHYFNTDLPILPNKSFVFEREELPYKFVEVTEKVAFPE